MRDARLDGARLSGVDRTAAAIEGASFSRADLTGARLERLSIDRVDARSARLERANLTGATGRGVVLRGACMRSIQAPGLVLAESDAERVDAADAVFVGARLDRVRWVPRGGDERRAVEIQERLGCASRALLGEHALNPLSLSAAASTDGAGATTRSRLGEAALGSSRTTDDAALDWLLIEVSGAAFPQCGTSSRTE